MSHCIEYGKGNDYPRTFRSGKAIRLCRFICAITYNLRMTDDTWVARHRCDNKKCIRIEHIIPGTIADNVRDRDERGLTARGMRNGKAKLTDEQIVAIRADNRTHQQIADEYNVARSTISMIRLGERR